MMTQDFNNRTGKAFMIQHTCSSLLFSLLFLISAEVDHLQDSYVYKCLSWSMQHYIHRDDAFVSLKVNWQTKMYNYESCIPTISYCFKTVVHTNHNKFISKHNMHSVLNIMNQQNFVIVSILIAVYVLLSI